MCANVIDEERGMIGDVQGADMDDPDAQNGEELRHHVSAT